MANPTGINQYTKGGAKVGLSAKARKRAAAVKNAKAERRLAVIKGKDRALMGELKWKMRQNMR